MAEQYRNDPLRQDAFERAERVYRMLEAVTPIEDVSAIPPDSLLREFIAEAATNTNGKPITDHQYIINHQEEDHPCWS
jgi:hypothetical protein